jgi:hypothetical protein
MKILIFLFLLTFSFISIANEPVLEAEEYEVTDEKSIMVNGEKFVQYQIKKKNFNYECPIEKRFEFSPELIIAHTAVNAAMAYTVMNINPEKDKIRHALVGYIVGNATGGALQLFLPRDMKNRNFWIVAGAIFASVAVGVGNEIRDDMGYGMPDNKDAIATILGGIGGTITIRFADIGKPFRRKK